MVGPRTLSLKYTCVVGRQGQIRGRTPVVVGRDGPEEQHLPAAVSVIGAGLISPRSGGDSQMGELIDLHINKIEYSA